MNHKHILLTTSFLIIISFTIGCTDNTPSVETLCTEGVVNGFISIFGRGMTMEWFNLTEEDMDSLVWQGDTIVNAEGNCRLSYTDESIELEYAVEKDEFGEYSLTEWCITDEDGKKTCYDYEALLSWGPFYGSTSSTLLEYTNFQYGIQISYPSNWEVVESFGTTVVSFTSLYDSLSDVIRENVNIVMQDLSLSPMTLDDYMELNFQQLEELLTGYTLISYSPTDIPSNPSYKIEYSGYFGTSLLKWMQVYTIKDDIAYIITYTAEPSRYSELLDTVNEMVDSFQILI